MQRHATLVRVAPSVLIGALAVALTGCGGKVSQSNFDKVTVGMTQAEVEAILGPGTPKSTAATPGLALGGVAIASHSAKVLQWTDGSKTIVVSFVDDKVTTKTASGL
jgi:hypothetical protein